MCIDQKAQHQAPRVRMAANIAMARANQFKHDRQEVGCECCPCSCGPGVCSSWSHEVGCFSDELVVLM
jgi:hypothetical protein